MVSKKVSKKTAPTKKLAAKKSLTKTVVAKKVPSKKVPAKKRVTKKAASSLDLNQAMLDEARAILAKRSATGQSIDAGEFARIFAILEKIAMEIHELIVLFSTR